MDVEEWLRRRLPTLFTKYGAIFMENNITGRVLVEITDTSLCELGILDCDHRQELLHGILREKLRSDLEELTNIASSSRFT
uniref:SAM domain-containing protein n=1 Tax=Plectus sambesii TaxID=2011161 RepID=A0A914X8B9_9BILA